MLIDFKTRATLAKEIAVGTDWVSAASADDGHPWNALSQPAKVQMLRRLIARQVDQHLPPLIKAQ